MTLEAFGLFNLLKSVLSAMPQSEGNPPSATDSPDAKTDPQPMKKTGEYPINKEYPPDPLSPPEKSAAQNACLGFLDAHERRAKRNR